MTLYSQILKSYSSCSATKSSPPAGNHPPDLASYLRRRIDIRSRKLWVAFPDILIATLSCWQRYHCKNCPDDPSLCSNYLYGIDIRPILFVIYSDEGLPWYPSIKIVTKARKLGVSTSVLYVVDPLMHTLLTFEYVEGPTVKYILLDFGLYDIVQERLDDIATQIGDEIGTLHDGGLIHGDLITSNISVYDGTNKLALIDFGLSFTSTLPEDKAVDLYVIERALLSMHSSCEM